MVLKRCQVPCCTWANTAWLATVAHQQTSVARLFGFTKEPRLAALLGDAPVKNGHDPTCCRNATTAQLHTKCFYGSTQVSVSSTQAPRKFFGVAFVERFEGSGPGPSAAVRAVWRFEVWAFGWGYLRGASLFVARGRRGPIIERQQVTQSPTRPFFLPRFGTVPQPQPGALIPTKFGSAKT